MDGTQFELFDGRVYEKPVRSRAERKVEVGESTKPEEREVISGVETWDHEADLDSISRITYSNNIPVTISLFQCSHSFRIWLLASFPHLADPRLLRFAAFLLAHSYDFHDDLASGNDCSILVSRKTLEQLTDYKDHSHSFRGEDFLSEFSKNIWPIVWSNFNAEAGLARKVTSQSWPRELEKHLLSELSNGDHDLVDLVTGEPKAGPDLPADTASPVPEIEAIRQSLNSVPPELFEAIRLAVPLAREYVHGQRWSKRTKIGQLSLLRKIEMQPKPHYRAVEATLRLYAVAGAYLALKREVRALLTAHLWKFDIVSAQLMIASATWDFDLSRYMVEGSVWKYILRAMGKRTDCKELKDKIKTFMYSLLFGASKSTLRDQAQRLGCVELMNIDLVQHILRVRDDVLNRIKNCEVFPDAWGRQRQVNQVTSKKRVDARARSMMAALCQSWELRLLQPVFQYAQAEGLEIVGLLHDGIFCHGDWEPHVDKVASLVAQAAEDLLHRHMTLEADPPRQL